MKTNSIFRAFLMAVVLFMGIGSVQADVTKVWPEDSEWGDFSSGSLFIDASKFGGVSEGVLLRIYGEIQNEWNWRFGVFPNGHFKSDYFTNWEGADWGNDNGWQDCNNGYNDYSEGYFEFEMTEEGAEELSKGGLVIPVVNFFKVTRVEIVSNLIGFPIKISSNGHGFVIADKDSAEEGEDVILTISPEVGYELDKISAFDDNGNEVVLEGSGDTRTFSMPDSKVTIVVRFARIITLSADEVELWGGSPTMIWNGSEYDLFIDDTEWLLDAIEGTRIRIYADKENDDWKLGVGQMSFQNANGEFTRYYDPCYVTDGGYFELVFGNETASKLLNIGGFAISFHDVSIYKIVYIKNEIETFSVTINNTQNGSIEATPTSAAAGESITLTIYADEGYELDWLIVRDENNNDIEIKNGQFIMPASNVTISAGFRINVPAAEYVEAAITSSTGYATFCSDRALDFSGVSGLKAYYAKSVSEDIVILEQVTGSVAAGTGLIIVGGTTDIPVVEYGNEITDNLLVGVLSEETIINSSSSYVLTEENGKVKFASTENISATVSVGRAYLHISSLSNYSRLSVGIRGEATSIEESTLLDDQEDKIYYDLRGMRITNPTHGIYIVNGKKVFMKNR